MMEFRIITDFSDMFLLVVFLILILFPLKYKVQHESDIRKVLDYDGTKQLKGLAITFVLFHHIAQRTEDLFFLKPFIYVGHISVALFLFVSGYSLAVSFDSKRDYLDGFLIKRIQRVYIPFVIVNGILVTGLIVSSKVADIKILSSILGLVLLDKTQWFIFCIILFYLFYWVSMLVFKSQKIAIYAIFSMVLIYIFTLKYNQISSYWYVSSLAFPFGLFVYNYRCNLSLLFVNKAIAYVAMFLFLLCFIMGDLLGFWFFSLFASMLLPVVLICTLMHIKFKSNYLGFAGMISLEIYLFHMKILYFFYDIKITKSSFLYVVISIVTMFFLSYLYKFFSNNLFKLKVK